jgi:hypothetical protein
VMGSGAVPEADRGTPSGSLKATVPAWWIAGLPRQWICLAAAHGQGSAPGKGMRHVPYRRVGASPPASLPDRSPGVR